MEIDLSSTTTQRTQMKSKTKTGEKCLEGKNMDRMEWQKEGQGDLGGNSDREGWLKE